MRIAIVHWFYRRSSPSGENTIVESQARALAERGHDVLLLGEHSPEEISLTGKLQTGFRVALRRGSDPTAALLAFQPDIVHVHNLFPHFSYHWLKKWPSALVVTLHNYRPICATATLFRNDQACFDCLQNRWAGLQHRCYRDSFAATAPIAWRNRQGVNADPLLRRADHLIFLSERSRGIYQQAGLVDRRSTVLPNGLPDLETGGERQREGWAYVGRFSPEKGVRQLLANWPSDRNSLTLIGDGPQWNSVWSEYRENPGLDFRGRLTQDQTRAVIASSEGVVIPSRWAEGMPLVLGEALRAGTPVLARAGSSAADFIAQVGGGSVYESDALIGESVKKWRMRATEAREVFENHLSEAVWIRNLERIYTRSTT